jgi:hypothetical protein
MGIGWSVTPLTIEPPSLTADGWSPDYTFTVTSGKMYAPASDSNMAWFGKPNSWYIYRSRCLTDQIIAASQGILTPLSTATYCGAEVNGNVDNLGGGKYRPGCPTMMEWKLSNMQGLDWAGSLSGAWEPRRIFAIGSPIIGSSTTEMVEQSTFFYKSNIEVAVLLSSTTNFNLSANWAYASNMHRGLPYVSRNTGSYVLSHPQHGIIFVSNSSIQGADQPYFLVIVPDKVTSMMLGLFDSSLTPSSYSNIIQASSDTPFINRSPTFYPYGQAVYYPVGSSALLFSAWTGFAGNWRKGPKIYNPVPVMLSGMPCAYFTTGDVFPAADEPNHWLKIGWKPHQQWHHFVADGSVWLTSARSGGEFALRLDNTWTESSLKANLYNNRVVKVIT